MGGKKKKPKAQKPLMACLHEIHCCLLSLPLLALLLPFKSEQMFLLLPLLLLLLLLFPILQQVIKSTVEQLRRLDNFFFFSLVGSSSSSSPSSFLESPSRVRHLFFSFRAGSVVNEGSYPLEVGSQPASIQLRSRPNEKEVKSLRLPMAGSEFNQSLASNHPLLAAL